MIHYAHTYAFTKLVDVMCKLPKQFSTDILRHHGRRKLLGLIDLDSRRALIDMGNIQGAHTKKLVMPTLANMEVGLLKTKTKTLLFETYQISSFYNMYYFFLYLRLKYQI